MFPSVQQTLVEETNCRIDRTKIADKIEICEDSGRTSKTLVGSREKITFTARSRTADCVMALTSLLSPSNFRQPFLMRPGYIGKLKMRAQNIILHSAPLVSQSERAIQ